MIRRLLTYFNENPEVLADLIFMKDDQFTIKEESLVETLNMSFFERIDKEHYYSAAHIRFLTRLIEVFIII